MNNGLKKGFTITELVIVIAVVAILAAVLIPTFSGVVTDAQKSNDLQLATNINSVLASVRNPEGDVLSWETAENELSKNGIRRLKVSYKNNALYWDPAEGYVVLYNYDEDRALAPANYLNVRGTDNWELLDGEINPNSTFTVVKSINPGGDKLMIGGYTDMEEVAANGQYILSIQPVDGYVTTYFKVTMAGKDVSDTVIKNGTDVSIDRVTGPVEITYYAVKNAVATSTHSDGATIFGCGLVSEFGEGETSSATKKYGYSGIVSGYKKVNGQKVYIPGNGYVIGGRCTSDNSNGDELYLKEASGYMATGLMAIENLQTFYIKGAAFDKNNSGSSRIVFFKSLKGQYDTTIGASSFSSYFDVIQVGDYYKFTVKADKVESFKAYKYFKFSAVVTAGAEADVVVSIGEPMFPDSLLG